jgi:hypothetical protein
MILAPDEFRRIALSLPQAEETYRRGQSEFRVARRTFAILGGSGDSVVTVYLTPSAPKAFAPVAGG